MPNFEYQFRLVDKDDPRAAGGGLIPRADVVVENKIEMPQSGAAKAQAAPKDVYSELIKLDDLRKKGIISDAEFEARKTKILQEN
jgi:hypothetical protein